MHLQLQPRMFCITGVNTAGKTTVLTLLKKTLDSKRFAVYDLDERGVPNNVTGKWRQSETNYYLGLAAKNAKQGLSTVLCGVTIPSEIKAAKNFTKAPKVYIALLDVSKTEIAKRLKKRYADPKLKKHMLRATNLPVNRSITANINHARHLRRICKEYKTKVFNTSHTTPKATLIKITRWIYM